MRHTSRIPTIFASLLLAASAFGVITLGTPQPASAAGWCTAGDYNYRQARTGACAWGNVKNVSGSGAARRFDVVVRDTKSDGHCATFHLKIDLRLSPDVHKKVKACGYKSSAVYQATPDGPTGTGFATRVCQGSSCTSWKHH